MTGLHRHAPRGPECAINKRRANLQPPTCATVFSTRDTTMERSPSGSSCLTCPASLIDADALRTHAGVLGQKSQRVAATLGGLSILLALWRKRERSQQRLNRLAAVADVRPLGQQVACDSSDVTRATIAHRCCQACSACVW